MDFDDIAPIIVLISLLGLWIWVCIKADSEEKQKQYIFDNSQEYIVFNKCEKIYDRYYCKND